MPIQDLEKLFNMKINKYEMQGQPLEQAAASAAGEMKQDPRVMQLVKTYQGQMAQPQDVNVRKEGQPKATSQGGGNAGMGIVNLMTTAIKQGLFGQTKQGEDTETPTDTTEPKEGSPEWMQKYGVKKYSEGESISPILAARSQYKNLKMAEESSPYQLPLKGYATPPTYFGIGLNKKLTDMLKKQPIEKEEEEAINQFKTSMKYSLELFKPEELDYRYVDGKKYAKKPSSGSASKDLFQTAKDDDLPFITNGVTPSGAKIEIENLSGIVNNRLEWANAALTAESGSGKIYDGTAEELLNQAVYKLYKQNSWTDGNKPDWEREKPLLAEMAKETYKKLLDVQHGDDMLDADKTKATDEWFDRRKNMAGGNEEEELIQDLVNQYNALTTEAAKDKALKSIANTAEPAVAKSVFIRLQLDDATINSLLSGVK